MATKKKPEERTGNTTGPMDDPRYIALTRGQSKRKDIPIPEAAEQWHPQAKSWFNALKMSGQSDFFEASDWATAVFCAQLYDLFMRTQRANVLPAFERLSSRLGVTVVDRKRNRIELGDEDVTDKDEEAAKEAVIKWHGRLGIVRDTDGEEADG